MSFVVEAFRQVRPWLEQQARKRGLWATRRALLSELVLAFPELAPSAGLILQEAERRLALRALGFGDLFLLRPRLLETYASALLDAAARHPKGRGVLWTDELSGDKLLLTAEGAQGRDEQLLILLALSELVRKEQALRLLEEGREGFWCPTQTRQPKPSRPSPPLVAVWSLASRPQVFWGPLVGRLVGSGVFTLDEGWAWGARLRASVGGVCALVAREAEGGAQVEVAVDSAGRRNVQLYLERFLESFLQKYAPPDSLKREPRFACAGCKTPLTDLQAERRKERGFDWIACNVCGARLQLHDPYEHPEGESRSLAVELEQAAKQERARQVASLTLAGKRLLGEVDGLLFACAEDRAPALKVGQWLEERGSLPWVAAWDWRVDLSGDAETEARLSKIPAILVMVGAGRPLWEVEWRAALLQRLQAQGRAVGLVVLPSAQAAPSVPGWLEGVPSFDFRDRRRDVVGEVVEFLRQARAG